MSEFEEPEYEVNQPALYSRSFAEKYRVTIVKVSPETEEDGWRYTVKFTDVDKPDKEVFADSLERVDDYMYDNAAPPAPPPASIPPSAPAPASRGNFGGGGGIFGGGSGGAGTVGGSTFPVAPTFGSPAHAGRPAAGAGGIGSGDNNEATGSNTDTDPASIVAKVMTEEKKKKAYHGTVFQQLFAFRSRHKEPGSAAEEAQITKAIEEELRSYTGSENTLLRIEAKNNDEDPSMFGAGNRLLLANVFKQFDPEMMTEIDGIVAYMENKSDDDIIIELIKRYPSFDPAKYQLKIADPAKAASAVSFCLNQSANKIDKAVSTANESMGMTHCLDFLQKEVPDDIRSRICEGADTLSGNSRIVAPSDGTVAMSEVFSYEDEKGAINSQVWRRSDDPQYCVASAKKLENTRDELFGYTGADITECREKIYKMQLDEMLGKLGELKKRRFHDSGPYILNLSYNGVVPQEQPIALNASFWGGNETEQRSNIALWVECMLLSQTFPVRFDTNLRALYPSGND